MADKGLRRRATRMKGLVGVTSAFPNPRTGTQVGIRAIHAYFSHAGIEVAARSCDITTATGTSYIGSVQFGATAQKENF